MRHRFTTPRKLVGAVLVVLAVIMPVLATEAKQTLSFHDIDMRYGSGHSRLTIKGVVENISAVTIHELRIDAHCYVHDVFITKGAYKIEFPLKPGAKAKFRIQAHGTWDDVVRCDIFYTHVPTHDADTGSDHRRLWDKILQCAMKKLGYNSGPIDGIWGERSQASYQQFLHDYYSSEPDKERADDVIAQTLEQKILNEETCMPPSF